MIKMDEEKVTQEQLQLVSFFLGGEEYALNSKLVQQIIELREITPIPQSPDFMEGVIDLRGEIIPIINLHLRLGLEKKPLDEKSRIIIIESKGSLMGF
ncbi:MAG: chemotaxis protein CheW, partial [Armatimonadetes bacterium CG07_land_8_20_14_0_80_40_9]